MATAIIDGIPTHYDVLGSGPPLLMFSPGGFDATISKWRTQGVYAVIKPLDHLPSKFTCIVFDRRETGESGGRVECVTWAHYVAQGKGLLDHLKIDRAHIMGACMGCSPVLAFGVAHPQATLSMLLYWPVGGVHYRLNNRERFNQHLAFVKENGLDAVVALVTAEGKPFNQDPRGGPWASVIKRDRAFAEQYAAADVAKYTAMVAEMGETLVDRDTAPGATPEELMRLDIPALIVPGRDKTHATSAARYLEECLPRSEYWDIPVAEQTEATVMPRLLGWLGATFPGTVPRP
jgi:pimeloyl-ACP methyl ester carboxylesterase